MMHSYTLNVEPTDQGQAVLILVLMDDALVLTKRKEVHNENRVLILVLMDDALVPFRIFLKIFFKTCLNPCFNG